MTDISNEYRKKETLQVLFIYLISLCIPFALYALRSLDDNRLTSWAWVFSIIPFSKFLFVFVPAMFFAYLFSRTSFFLSASR